MNSKTFADLLARHHVVNPAAVTDAEDYDHGVTLDRIRAAFAALELEAMQPMREDVVRLDLLDRNAALRDRPLAMMERGADHEPIRWAGIEWDGRERTIRDEIDFHRNC